jgi:putative DNA primase/helicase
MLNEIDRAREALFSIPPDCDRDTWVKLLMAANDAGLDFETVNDWSAGAGNYQGERDVQAVWRSIKPGGRVTVKSLFKAAAEHGYRLRSKEPAEGPRKPAQAPKKSRPGEGAIEVWNRCQEVTHGHPYIKAKAGNPKGVRVVSDGDPLVIRGERVAGWLAVPVCSFDGTLLSLQFIATPDVAANLKANGKPGKLNLPGSMGGVFIVGKLEAGGTVYFVEGIGAAWAIQKANGGAAVVCFGAGNMRSRAVELRERDPAATLVIVPDVGKEAQADAIAREVRGCVVRMPEGWPQNSDVNDMGLRDGFPALEALLATAKAPPEPEPRYKLLGAAELRDLPPLAWRIRGVLPAAGLASMYGPSASGKSFLALDMAAAIASGRPWFDRRTMAAPVVYCALEGEAGFRLRVAAWEAVNGEPLPPGLRMMLQPFKLTEPQDVQDLAAAVLRMGGGAVTILDTLNRAAPTADENSSKDMGAILEACKALQAMTGGLVVVVHHTGKDATKGLRGHSSLFAALDAAIEVSRTGDRREWLVAKAKDGQDGEAQPFKLRVVELGNDDDGEPVTSCVVARDMAGSDIKRVKLPQGGNQRVVWDALGPLFKAGVFGKPGAPPNRPCIELEAAITAAAPRLMVEADRRTERTRAAITGLVTRGLMGCNDGWLWCV